MPFFERAQQLHIYGGNFTEHSFQFAHDQDRHALEELRRNSTKRAFHDSRDLYDPPKCLKQTREAVFREIKDWLHNTSAEKPILWIYGPAGAGKSAIARSTAENAEEMGYRLITTFFFNRSDTERNTTARLIPSMASRMISTIPSTRRFVLKAISDHPHIFTLNVRSQWEILIARPLLDADISLSQVLPMLIVVDGLDECLREYERSEFLNIVKEFSARRSFPLAFLCTSRPEGDIRGTFNEPQLLALSDRIVLDDHFNPSSDIEKFLIHEFTKIKTSHPLSTQMPQSWPPEPDIWKLVEKSSGQFIYAATVVKQVASRRHNPMDQFKIILELREGSPAHASPFRELDALYDQILSSIPDDDRSIVVRILGLICSSDIDVDPYTVDAMFLLNSGHGLLLLQDLHSLIDVRGPHNKIQPFHASLSDFLTDRSRSGIYHVNPVIITADKLLLRFERCLHHLDRLSQLDFFENLRIIPSHQNYRLVIPTNELCKYFMRLPWGRVWPTGGLIYLIYHQKKWKETKEFIHGQNHTPIVFALDAYRYCEWVSTTSLEEGWAVIYNEALHAFRLWIVQEIHNLPLTGGCCEETSVLLSRHSWECRRPSKWLIWYLYTQSFVRGWDRDQDLHSVIRLVLKDPSLSGHFHISRIEHNYIVHNHILYWIVHGNPSPTHAQFIRDDAFYNSYEFVTKGYTGIAAMLDSTERAACLDKIISHAELVGPESLVSPNSNCGAAILRYKAKPILSDYDYDYQLSTPIYRGMENPPYLFLDLASQCG